MIRDQFILGIDHEIIVDNFAGGGGASTGIELALGRHCDLSWNHDPEAVAMHKANHPQTLHFCQDVFDAHPVEACAGRPVGLAWFSPDCTHFSKARGQKPRKKKIRGLAWVVVKWAATVRPRVIILENVEEFQTWGPLLKNGQPCPRRSGRTFKNWLARLRNLGYAIEWRELRACDYGAPTIRKRLFVIARCDGKPIVWPEPTHADPKSTGFLKTGLKPWRTAAECIDWSIPCPSIFERKRPLAPATCRRIAKGIMRYVVNCAEPFIVPLTHHDSSDRARTMADQMPTITGAHRGELAMVAPVLTEHANQKHERNFDPQTPLRTQCSEVKGGHFALVAPVIAGLAHGDHARGAGRRTKSPEEPVGTIHAQGGNHALVSAFLAKHYGGHETPGWPLEKAASTITAKDHHGLVTASLVGVGGRAAQIEPRTGDKPVQTVTGKADSALLSACLVPRYGERPMQDPRAMDVEKPAATVVPTGNGGSLVTAHLTKFRTGSTGSDAAEPMHTITAGPKENPAGAPHAMGLVTAHVEKMHGTSTGQAAGDPLHTVGAQGNHFAEVRAFLIKYYGTEQDPKLREPLHTVTSKDRFGLVTIKGVDYAIVDIGLRMLAPRELFRAQGFPASYIIGDNPSQGLELTKSAQVRMCGNSVCPPLAAALVRANVPELSAWSADELKRRVV